jgi:hypothetical protein
MEYGGADAYECGGGEHGAVAGCHGESQQANHRDAHAHGQGVRLRPVIGIESDDGLEQRSSQLDSKSDKTNLAEIKMERVFEQRINRRHQRLQRVIQEMAKTDGKQNFEYSFRASVRLSLSLNGG